MEKCPPGQEDVSSLVVNMKSAVPQTAPSEYPASEIYSSDPPPAYMKSMKSSSVQIARIIGYTLVACSVILGCFLLACSYINATMSCSVENLPPPPMPFHQDMYPEAVFQRLVDPLMAGESRHDALKGNALAEDSSPSQTATADQKISEDAKRQDSAVNSIDDNDDKNVAKQTDEDDENDDDPITIRLPVQLDFDDIASAIMDRNIKSKMNCVVERRTAEEVTDHQPRSVSLPFGVNLTTDPSHRRIVGQTMAISCQSGNSVSEPSDSVDELVKEIVRPIVVPVAMAQQQQHQPPPPAGMMMMMPPRFQQQRPIPNMPYGHPQRFGPMMPQHPQHPAVQQPPMHPGMNQPFHRVMFRMQPPVSTNPMHQINHPFAALIAASGFAKPQHQHDLTAANSDDEEEVHIVRQVIPILERDYDISQHRPPMVNNMVELSDESRMMGGGAPVQMVEEVARLMPQVMAEVANAVAGHNVNQASAAMIQSGELRPPMAPPMERQGRAMMPPHPLERSLHQPHSEAVHEIPIIHQEHHPEQPRPVEMSQHDYMRPHYVQPRSVRSVENVLKREKRVKRCACDCAC